MVENIDGHKCLGYSDGMFLLVKNDGHRNTWHRRYMDIDGNLSEEYDDATFYSDGCCICQAKRS